MTMDERRILILLQNEPIPHDRHVWNQSRALARAGYDVNVVCPAGEDRDRDPFERIDGVSIHRYKPRTAEGGPLSYMLEYLAALWSMRRLARRLARDGGGFDLVHACSPPDFLLLAALGLRRQGARFVFDHHDLTPELYLTRFGPGLIQRMTLAAEQIAFRSADVVISVNDSYRQIAIERGHRDPDDVLVVRTGPDLSRFVPRPPDPSLKRGKPYLLAYAGVMGPQDGVDQALLALAELKSQRQDWHAVFMGDGAVFGEMQELAARLGLDECVEFSGWVEHDTIGAVLSTADVCLAPDPKTPLNDISSMVKISEYMAMSKPIVSYDLVESRIGAGEAALFAAPQDHTGFAGLVSKLLDDPQRRQAMGRAGRLRAEGFLAWAHQERSLLAAYSRALAMGPAQENHLEILGKLFLPGRNRRRKAGLGARSVNTSAARTE
jgi:glycosyltransferase involved in cell wall biosynthesis